MTRRKHTFQRGSLALYGNPRTIHDVSCPSNWEPCDGCAKVVFQVARRLTWSWSCRQLSLDPGCASKTSRRVKLGRTWAVPLSVRVPPENVDGPTVCGDRGQCVPCAGAVPRPAQSSSSINHYFICLLVHSIHSSHEIFAGQGRISNMVNFGKFTSGYRFLLAVYLALF